MYIPCLQLHQDEETPETWDKHGHLVTSDIRQPWSGVVLMMLISTHAENPFLHAGEHELNNQP